LPIHPILLKHHSGIECPPCFVSKRPLHEFTSSRALMTHITKAHNLPNTEFKKIRRWVRIFEKKNPDKSFLKWMKKRGYLK